MIQINCAELIFVSNLHFIGGYYGELWRSSLCYINQHTLNISANLVLANSDCPLQLVRSSIKRPMETFLKKGHFEEVSDIVEIWCLVALQSNSVFAVFSNLNTIFLMDTLTKEQMSTKNNQTSIK